MQQSKLTVEAAIFDVPQDLTLLIGSLLDMGSLFSLSRTCTQHSSLFKQQVKKDEVCVQLNISFADQSKLFSSALVAGCDVEFIKWLVSTGLKSPTMDDFSLAAECMSQQAKPPTTTDTKKATQGNLTFSEVETLKWLNISIRLLQVASPTVPKRLWRQLHRMEI